MAAPLAALAIVGGLFVVSQRPRLSHDEAVAMARRFAFEKQPLPEVDGYRHQEVREVHPSLMHLSAQISFVGAAVALGDLDGDGLPNDLIHVDPRNDQVVVTPAPGSGDRYPLFTLDASPLAFDAATTAPMGSLIGDFDEDGLADVLVYYWGRSPVLFFRGPAGAPSDSPTEAAPNREDFTPVELVAPPRRWNTSACTQADLDGDGHIDLVVGNNFADDSRILDAKAPGRAEMPESFSRAFNGGRSRLFLWGSDAQGAARAGFREVEGVLADEVAGGWTLAVGAADLDGDLLPEIYLVQDWGPDRLLHNRSQAGQLRFELLHGERTFTTPSSKVVGCDSFNGMGIDFGDLNGDGRPDIFVSNITSAYGLHESNFLFLSTGQTERMRSGVAPYRDASEAWGVSRSGWAWEARLADFDNDGTLEALQATGYAKGTIDRWADYHETALANDQLLRDPRVWPRVQPGDNVAGSDVNPFYVRAADGRYYDLARELGLAEAMNSRGIATADVDGDGLLDFAVANQWGPSFLFRNRAPSPGRFLGLALRLPVGDTDRPFSVSPGHPNARRDGPSRPALGAAAEVHLSDGRRLVGQVDGGNGHSGKRAPELHFGLGAAEVSEPLRVDLRWRGVKGDIREKTLHLPPGWHTVLLGGATHE